jgi:(p)ppGpp synthase/HD superfamily hydrolase
MEEWIVDDAAAHAERVAREAHVGQVDKAGRPYIDHPRRVAARVAEVDGRPAAVAVAWLHDVVEDTPTTLEDLRDAGFGADVVAAVDALTRRPGEGDDYYLRVASDDLATVVKLADIWDNTNPERLARLSPDDQARLEQKYRHALEAISAAKAQQ